MIKVKLQDFCHLFIHAHKCLPSFLPLQIPILWMIRSPGYIVSMTQSIYTQVQICTCLMSPSLSFSMSSRGVNESSISSCVNSGCLSALKSSSLKHLHGYTPNLSINQHFHTQCGKQNSPNLHWSNVKRNPVELIITLTLMYSV
jgi:hypothetical protein